MIETLLAYCGINCSGCPILIATSDDDDKLRHKTLTELTNHYADTLESFGIHNLKPEDINCCGCRSERGHFIGCAACEIRKCCLERQIGICSNCGEYESCHILKAFYSITAHQEAKANLDRLRIRNLCNHEDEIS